MPDFSARSTLPEKMDDPSVPEREVHQALRELEVINKLLGGFSVTLHALEGIPWPQSAVVTVMDIGSGGGDMLRAIAEWARSKQRKVVLTGVDWNPVMTEYATNMSRNYPDIQYKTMSVFDDRLLEESVDITTCTLFCHHFDKEQLIVLIQRMHRLAKRAVIINDLQRHWFAYYAISVLTALFSKTYLVKYDARLSVARSLTRREWKEVLAEAGIEHYKLTWEWAWRWELVIEKQVN